LPDSRLYTIQSSGTNLFHYSSSGSDTQPSFLSRLFSVLLVPCSITASSTAEVPGSKHLTALPVICYLHLWLQLPSQLLDCTLHEQINHSPCRVIAPLVRPITACSTILNFNLPFVTKIRHCCSPVIPHVKFPSPVNFLHRSLVTEPDPTHTDRAEGTLSKHDSIADPANSTSESVG
jgi:hypothetical protein